MTPYEPFDDTEYSDDWLDDFMDDLYVDDEDYPDHTDTGDDGPIPWQGEDIV